MTDSRSDKIHEADAKVVSALQQLPRVDAPPYFEARLKARIANERPRRSPWSFGFPRLTIGAAALLAVVFGVTFLMTGRRGAEEVAVNTDLEKSVPPVAAVVPPIPQPNDSSVRPETARNDVNSNASVSVQVKEEAAKTAQTVELGIGSKETFADAKGSSVAVADALSSIGATASFEGGAWMVKVVQGRAGASGLKQGDAVISIDGVTLGPETSFQAPFTCRMLLIKRPGNEKLLPLAVR